MIYTHMSTKLKRNFQAFGIQKYTANLVPILKMHAHSLNKITCIYIYIKTSLKKEEP